jgi:hypothetical protein
MELASLGLIAIVGLILIRAAGLPVPVPGACLSLAALEARR